jgi:RNA polymerase sigma-70 factor, ECF subfamily
MQGMDRSDWTSDDPTTQASSTKVAAPLEPSEFERLYREHSQAIYYLALRLLGDPTQAEDATHDVFLKAFRKLAQFRGEAGVRTWLYRIAINHCRNLVRTWYHRHVSATEDEAVWEATPGPGENPFRLLETKELGRRIQNVLDALPEEYRLLLLLVADEQLSYEQIAALTQQSADAVRGKLHRARKAFALKFKDRESGAAHAPAASGMESRRS